MPTVTLELNPPSAVPPVQGFRLFFDVSRTALTEWFALPPFVELTNDPTFIFPAVEFRFGPIDDGAALPVQLGYVGEEPTLREVAWSVGPPDQWQFWPVSSFRSGFLPEMPVADHAARKRGIPDLAEARTNFVVEVIEEGCDRILNEIRTAEEAGAADGTRDERVVAMKFFFDLDLNTNRDLFNAMIRLADAQATVSCLDGVPEPDTDYDDRDDAIHAMTKTLGECLEFRLADLLGLGATPPVVDIEILKDVSRAQFAVYRRHFCEGTGFDAGAIQRSFELFAAGELRDPVADSDWNARPNSLFFSMFAEFAIQCLDQGVDTELWEVALPALVSTQEIFAWAHPGTGVRSLGTAAVPVGSGRVTPFSGSFEAVRRFYLNLDPDELRAAHAHNSLYLRSPHAPYSGELTP